ncbi:alpha/beta hydrolase domain-containing protein [Paramicrobacterium fandaimingii]|uniref:alpha/beta hydrolase domain-containing protein n=1 Tax=Paramicrobacterium fandaimingii TaxID=2708079 RepID=UPI001421D5E0|nr:alpha/beta hydrolase domain-containing protein [Microbacterium fandaimingii]
MAAQRTVVTSLPSNAQSVPFGHDDIGVSELPSAGYAQTEVLLSGVAAGEAYTTRALLRHPADRACFSGVVLVEPMHWAGVRSVWRATRRVLVSGGHAWAEIASQSTSPQRLKSFDPVRYADVTLADVADDAGPAEASIGADAAAGHTFESVRLESDAFQARWHRSTVQSAEIIAHFADALREGATPLTGVTHVFLGGLSQSGGVTRAFATDHHRHVSREHPIFDGYLPMASGGEALTDLDVPVVELLGESELEELRARYVLPGQVRGFSHRRADSPRYRLYEVAGMGHTDSRDDPPPRSQAALPGGRRWSRFPNAHAVHFAWNALLRWVRDGTEPPHGCVIDTDQCGRILRDEHGHALGGLRSPYLDVPVVQVSAIAGAGAEWSCGSELVFDEARLLGLYGSESAYRSRVGACLDELVAEGYYLTDDAVDYLSRATWTK